MISLESADGPFGCLPPEILVKVFSFLSPDFLIFSISRVNWKWRTIVHRNIKQMQLIPVHCLVDVTDMDPFDETSDGTHPMIQYTFTVFDRSQPDYKQWLKACRRGNAGWTSLYISHRGGGTMDCEWESSLDHPRPVRAESETVATLLRHMRIEAMRFDVRKMGRLTNARMTDERFAHAIDFCERVCSDVNIKSLLLSSHSPLFPWRFGYLSQKKLISLRVKSLTLENMAAFDCFGDGKGVSPIDLSLTRHFVLKLDPSHRQELENILWVDIDGSTLSRLLGCHQRCLTFNAYTESPQVISTISAEDMVVFIRGWRSLSAPWIIRDIHFNSTVTISEFRTVATRLQMYERRELRDIPYCRFRTFHPSDPNVVMDLTCYGNGVSTQWEIRSGYPTARTEL